METTSRTNVAALRIHSRSMSVALISDCLGAQPSAGFDKGRPFSTRGDSRRLRDESIWILESGRSSELEDCVAQLVLFLEDRRTEVFKNSLEWELDVFCECGSGCGQAGFALSSELIKRLSAFPVDLMVDLVSE